MRNGKRLRRISLLLLIIMLMLVLASGLLTGCGSAKAPGPREALEGIDRFFHEKGNLKSTEDLTTASWYRPGDSITDWIMIMEERAGFSVDRERYLEDLAAYVTDCYGTDRRLDRAKATEWHRIALAVLYSGGDPTCFGQDASGQPVDLIADGIFYWQQTAELDTQGSNAFMYALNVLQAGGYTSPTDAVYAEEDMIAALLAYQGEDGGFSLSSRGSEVDLTAMALQALARYRENGKNYEVNGKNVTVTEACEQAVDYLAAQERQGGYYAFGAGYSSDSCAQVIMALCALGIDPEQDERFIKAGAGLVDALLYFRNADGGFAVTLGEGGKPEDSDLLSSREAGCALTALLMLRENGNGDYYAPDNGLKK